MEEIIIKDFKDFNDLVEKIDDIRNNPYNSEKIIIIDKKIEYTNQSIDKKINFSNCIFKKEIFFNNSIFEKKVDFFNTEFCNKVNLINTKFNNLVDFHGCIFEKPQRFFKTDFNEVVIFSNATFKKEVQFMYCKVKSSSYINFQSTKFEKNIDISRANFNCKVNFWDIQVNDKNLECTLLSEAYKNDFGNQETQPLVSKKLRESMRFIKNNFYAENNQIEGLKFYKKEMDIYREEIKQGNFGDKFILFLNSWSNDFGTSWLCGIIFTIIVGIIFFSLLLFSTNKFPTNNTGETLHNFGKLINIAQWSDIKIYGEEITGWSYVIFFIGRIFIGYGYYQTIQAFRKYGKS